MDHHKRQDSNLGDNYSFTIISASTNRWAIVRLLLCILRPLRRDTLWSKHWTMRIARRQLLDRWTRKGGVTLFTRLFWSQFIIEMEKGYLSSGTFLDLTFGSTIEGVVADARIERVPNAQPVTNQSKRRRHDSLKRQNHDRAVQAEQTGQKREKQVS